MFRVVLYSLGKKWVLYNLCKIVEFFYERPFRFHTKKSIPAPLFFVARYFSIYLRPVIN